MIADAQGVRGKRLEEGPVGAFSSQSRDIDDLGTDLGDRSTACDDVWLGRWRTSGARRFAHEHSSPG